MAGRKETPDALDYEGLALTPRDFVGAAIRALTAGVAVLCWGPPGLGKTEIINTVIAPQMDLEPWDFRLNSKDAVDLRGVPYINKRDHDGKQVTSWAAPEDLPTHPVLMFIDEIATANNATFAPAYQVIHERRLGNWVAHPRTRIIAASNREKDRAISNKMGSALLSRFTHFELRVDVDQWLHWAAASGRIESEVIGFIRFRPELLHDFDPLVTNMRTHPNPRTVEFLSRIVAQRPPEHTELAEYAGCVGPGFATEFLAFVKLYRQLPDIDKVLANPKTHPVPEGRDALSVRYALAAAIARRMDKTNFEAAVTFLDRLSEEFSVFAVQDALARDPSLAEIKGFSRWGVKAAGAGMIG